MTYDRNLIPGVGGSLFRRVVKIKTFDAFTFDMRVRKRRLHVGRVGRFVEFSSVAGLATERFKFLDEFAFAARLYFRPSEPLDIFFLTVVFTISSGSLDSIVNNAALSA